MSLQDETHSCPHCHKSISVRAKQCRHCQQFVSPQAPGALREPYFTAPPTSPAPAARVLSEVAVEGLSARAIRRYSDAYLIAVSVVRHGENIKSLAVLAAILVGIVGLVGGMAASKSGSDSMAFAGIFAGMLAALIVWSIIHARGVRIAAEGQHLLASLDVAVHTSPFLSNTERAKAMGL